MTKEPSTATAATPAPQPGQADDTFDALDRTLRDSGPAPAIARLIEQLDAAGEYRALLDALLLKARHELGLPLFQQGGPSRLPEPVRTQFEERYVEAVRLVGSKLLKAGQIPTAWAYFRAIAEPEPVAAALEAYQPSDDAEALGQIIDVAFNQGANPRRGFELILAHYGTCSAITALEQVPPGDTATQVACVERLIRHLHAQLAASVRADILQRGQLAPAAGTSIAGLIEGRDWLFREEGYHTDISHLSATVRYSILVTDPVVLALALDLAEYGRRLSPRLQFEGRPRSSGPSMTTGFSSRPCWATTRTRRSPTSAPRPTRRVPTTSTHRSRSRSWSHCWPAWGSSTRRSTSPLSGWLTFPSKL